MVLGGASLAQKLQIDNSLEVYFQDNDPAYVYYQNFMEEYGNDEFLYIVYRAGQGRFDLDALQKTEKLIEDLERIPYVEKVNAITNIEFMEGSEDGGLKVYGLMDEFPSSQVEANILIQKLMDKPLYVNRYISEDANLAAILCEMEDKPKDDPNYHLKIGAGLKSVLCNTNYQDFEFWPVGESVINHEYNEILKEDPQFLFMLSLITIFGLLLLFFRQAKYFYQLLYCRFEGYIPDGY
jgi:predicted RND superfamily exporter protein